MAALYDAVTARAAEASQRDNLVDLLSGRAGNNLPREDEW
jgi:hypothetical protein